MSDLDSAQNNEDLPLADGHSSLKEINSASLKSLEFPRIRAQLVRLAETEIAREILTNIAPAREVGWIRTELKRVDEVRHLSERGGNFRLGGADDVRIYLRKIAVIGSVLDPESLLAIVRHLRIFSSIRKLLDREHERMHLVYRITKSLKALPKVEDEIDHAISPEGLVRDQASPELGKIRRSLTNAQANIRRKIAQIASAMSRQNALREDNYTIRDGRYVLPVRSDAASRVKGIVHDRSSSGGTLFIEPNSVIELGNELRSLELSERDEIRRILAVISNSVRSHLIEIRDNFEVATTLDCLSAKARLASIMDAIVPEITTNGKLQLMHARHPLLTLDEKRKIVPLDIELGIDSTCLVISGPNAGGKSVALKCVGLVCAMTAAGLQIPALPGTVVPLVEKFFAVIGDQQSISDDLSTFTAHSRSLNHISEQADGKSLVLIDEIGAGTDPQEGASLSIALLEQMIERKVSTIVTTHHGALKAFAHTTDNCANGSMEFDRVNFRPVYKFQPNIPGSSYALEIARRVGMSEVLINRARVVLGSERSQVEELILSLSDTVRKYEGMIHGQEKAQANTYNYEEAYRLRLNRLKEKEKDIKKRSHETIEAIVIESRRSIEALVKEIRESQASHEAIKSAHRGLEELGKLKNNAPGHAPEQPPAEAKKKRRPRRRKPSGKTENATVEAAKRPYINRHKPIEVGDWVEIDGTGSRGEVLEKSSRKERLCVGVGSIQLWITFDRLKQAARPEVNKSGVIVFTETPNVPLELDVRGLDAAEALERVEQYLYDGASASRYRLGIVHGKGKGVLAKAVQDYLKKCSLVESYRFGEYGEGDYGVTIVELKSGKK